MKYKVGDKVIVNSLEAGKPFYGQIGTITKVDYECGEGYLISFEDCSLPEWWVYEKEIDLAPTFLKVGDLAVGKYTAEFGFRLDGVLGRVARVDKGDTLYPYLVEFFEKTRRTFFWVGKNDISKADEPKTKTQKIHNSMVKKSISNL